MDNSILEDVRVMCDINAEDSSFDGQLIPLINTFLFRSAQFGLGTKGFMISSNTETWSDFIPEHAELYAALKNYIGIRVKLIFDPPDNTGLLNALKEEAKELEWCLYAEADIVNAE